jgi:hypothetical protein
MSGVLEALLERGCSSLEAWPVVGEAVIREGPNTGDGLGLAVLAFSLEVALNLVPLWVTVAAFFPQSVMLWRAAEICAVEADWWLAALALTSRFLIVATVRPFEFFVPLAISVRMMFRIARWSDVVAPLEESSSML